jgi:hypothetical protein
MTASFVKNPMGKPMIAVSLPFVERERAAEGSPLVVFVDMSGSMGQYGWDLFGMIQELVEQYRGGFEPGDVVFVLFCGFIVRIIDLGDETSEVGTMPKQGLTAFKPLADYLRKEYPMGVKVAFFTDGGASDLGFMPREIKYPTSVVFFGVVGPYTQKYIDKLNIHYSDKVEAISDIGALKGWVIDEMGGCIQTTTAVDHTVCVKDISGPGEESHQVMPVHSDGKLHFLINAPSFDDVDVTLTDPNGEVHFVGGVRRDDTREMTESEHHVVLTELLSKITALSADVNANAVPLKALLKTMTAIVSDARTDPIMKNLHRLLLMITTCVTMPAINPALGITLGDCANVANHLAAARTSMMMLSRKSTKIVVKTTVKVAAAAASVDQATLALKKVYADLAVSDVETVGGPECIILFQDIIGPVFVSVVSPSTQTNSTVGVTAQQVNIASGGKTGRMQCTGFLSAHALKEMFKMEVDTGHPTLVVPLKVRNVGEARMIAALLMYGFPTQQTTTADVFMSVAASNIASTQDSAILMCAMMAIVTMHESGRQVPDPSNSTKDISIPDAVAVYVVTVADHDPSKICKVDGGPSITSLRSRSCAQVLGRGGIMKPADGMFVYPGDAVLRLILNPGLCGEPTADTDIGLMCLLYDVATVAMASATKRNPNLPKTVADALEKALIVTYAEQPIPESSLDSCVGALNNNDSVWITYIDSAVKAMLVPSLGPVQKEWIGVIFDLLESVSVVPMHQRKVMRPSELFPYIEIVRAILATGVTAADIAGNNGVLPRVVNFPSNSKGVLSDYPLVDIVRVAMALVIDTHSVGKIRCNRPLTELAPMLYGPPPDMQKAARHSVLAALAKISGRTLDWLCNLVVCAIQCDDMEVAAAVIKKMTKPSVLKKLVGQQATLATMLQRMCGVHGAAATALVPLISLIEKTTIKFIPALIVLVNSSAACRVALAAAVPSYAEYLTDPSTGLFPPMPGRKFNRGATKVLRRILQARAADLKAAAQSEPGNEGPIITKFLTVTDILKTLNLGPGSTLEVWGCPPDTDAPAGVHRYIVPDKYIPGTFFNSSPLGKNAGKGTYSYLGAVKCVTFGPYTAGNYTAPGKHHLERRTSFAVLRVLFMNGAALGRCPDTFGIIPLDAYSHQLSLDEVASLPADESIPDSPPPSARVVPGAIKLLTAVVMSEMNGAGV